MAESKIRVKHTQPFTTVFNSVLRDQRLSLKTLGLYVIMQSFPDDWEYSVSGLAARCRIGRDAIRKCLKELEEAGYLLKEQGQQENGKFACNTYVLQDEAPPCTEKPYTVKPSTVKPLTENQPQVKKHLSKDSSNDPPIAPQGAGCVDLFERFWAAYPRKQYKDRARRAWAKLSPDMDLCRKMSEALNTQKQSDQWMRDDGRYIPHPATWLNGRCWEDDPGPMYDDATLDRPEIPPDDERRGRYL